MKDSALGLYLQARSCGAAYTHTLSMNMHPAAPSRVLMPTMPTRGAKKKNEIANFLSPDSRFFFQRHFVSPKLMHLSIMRHFYFVFLNTLEFSYTPTYAYRTTQHDGRACVAPIQQHNMMDPDRGEAQRTPNTWKLATLIYLEYRQLAPFGF